MRVRGMLFAISEMLVALALCAGSMPMAHAQSSFQRACIAAHGNPKTLARGKTICRCGGLRKAINPFDERQAKACQAGSFQPLIDEIQNFNSTGNSTECPQCGYANNPNNSCDETLLGDMLADDKTGSVSERVLNDAASAAYFQETGAWPATPIVTADTPGSEWFGVLDPSEKMCTQLRTETTSPWQLEKYLSSNSRYRFGAGGEVISRCFASASDSDKKQAIAKYYYLNNRLRQADLAAIQSIASIDSLLGDDFKKSFSQPKGRGFQDICPDYLMRDRTRACEFYANQCGPKGGLEQMIPQTKEALQTRDKLEKEISVLRSKQILHTAADTLRMSAASGIAFANYQSQIQAKEKQVEVLEAANPWMKGKAFNSAADYYKGASRYQDGAIRDMIRKQLVQNRESLIKRLDQYRQATSCLNKESDERAGRCKDFDKTIENTPDLTFQRHFGRHDRLANLAEYYMGDAQCRWGVDNAKHMSNQTTEDFAVGATLTILTAGTSSVAAAAKLGTEGIAAASGLARGAELASSVFDAGFALNGGLSAYKGCLKALYQPGVLRAPSADSSGNFSCPANPYRDAAGVLNVTANMQACVTQTVAAAANVLPFVPKIAAGALRGGEKAAIEDAAHEVAVREPAQSLASHVEDLASASSPEFSAVTLRPEVLKSPEQVKNTLSNLQSANRSLAEALSHSENPAAFLAELKTQIPPGRGLMRVISPEEAANIIKEGGMGAGYDFGLTPADVRLGHGGNFVIVRCSQCEDIPFSPGELGSSKVNGAKIPASKLEFIVLKPRLAESVAQSVAPEQQEVLRQADSLLAESKNAKLKKTVGRLVERCKEVRQNCADSLRALKSLSSREAWRAGELEARTTTFTAPESGERIAIKQDRLEHAFKHRTEFGLDSSASAENLASFRKALEEHVKTADRVIPAAAESADGSTRELTAYLKGRKVVLVDAKTHEFVTAYELSPEKYQALIRTGKLIPKSELLGVEDPERFARAEKVLGRPVDEREWKAIWKAHNVGIDHGPPYSPQEIAEKARILREEGGFSTGRNGEIRKLQESWITGNPGALPAKADLSPEMRAYKSARREAENVMSFDIISSRKATITIDGGKPIEALQGFQRIDKDTIVVNGQKISLAGEKRVIIKQEGKIAEFPKKPIEVDSAPELARAPATDAVSAGGEPTHFTDPRQLESFMEANPGRSVTIQFSSGEKGATLVPAQNGNPAYIEYEGMSSTGSKTTMTLREKDWKDFKMYFQKNSVLSQPTEALVNGRMESRWVPDDLADKLIAAKARLTITRGDNSWVMGTLREIRPDGSMIIMSSDNRGVIVQPSQIKKIETKEMVQVFGPKDE